MFISLGLGLFKLAFVHLVAHGLVKALLFLSAGTVIHQTRSNQDLRVISGIIVKFPITGTCILLTSLILSGLPFGICFFSKETILNQNFLKRLWILITIYIAAVLTINYSLRLLKNLIYPPSFWNYTKISEKTFNTFWPLVNLLILPFWLNQLSVLSVLPFTVSINMYSFYLGILIWLLLTSFIFIGIDLSRNKIWGNLILNRLLSNLLFLPLLRSNLINKITVLGFTKLKNIETSWSESLGAQGLFYNISKRRVVSRLIFISIWLPVLVITIFIRFYSRFNRYRELILFFHH